MSEVESLGNVYKENWSTGFPGNVWNKDKISPALTTMQGGGKQPMIVDIETLGQMDNSDGTFESANRVYSSNGVSPTIPNCGGGGGLQPKVLDICIGGMQEHQAIKTDGISTTLTSSMGTGGGYVPMVIESKEENDINKWVWEVDGVKYLIRIRKLTPKECWRLMSFSDEDYEKAAEVNSNTQLYKQAGNSICSCVMESLFKELLKE